MSLIISNIRYLYNKIPFNNSMGTTCNIIKNIYKNGDYKTIFINNEISYPKMIDVLFSDDSSYRVHISVIPSNTSEVYKLPRYINLLEGRIDIESDYNRIKLISGGYQINSEHCIRYPYDNPCVLMSFTDITKISTSMPFL